MTNSKDRLQELIKKREKEIDRRCPYANNIEDFLDDLQSLAKESEEVEIECKKCRDEKEIIEKALQCGTPKTEQIKYKKLSMNNRTNLKKYNGKYMKLKINRGRDHNTHVDKIDIYIGKFEYGEHICYIAPCNINTSALEKNLSYDLRLATE